MKKKLLIIIFGLLFFSLILYFFINKSENIENKKVEIVVVSNELYNEFRNNETSANAKYLNKIIQIKGKISSIENDSVLLLDDKINVQFNSKISEEVNSSVEIKGRIIGYDALFEQVTIDNAIKIK